MNSSHPLGWVLSEGRSSSICPRRALSDEAETARAPQVSEREIGLGREIMAKHAEHTHIHTAQHKTTHNSFYNLYQNVYNIKTIYRLLHLYIIVATIYFSMTYLFIYLFSIESILYGTRRFLKPDQIRSNRFLLCRLYIFLNLDSGILSIFSKENVNWTVMAGNFCNYAIKVALLRADDG